MIVAKCTFFFFIFSKTDSLTVNLFSVLLLKNITIPFASIGLERHLGDSDHNFVQFVKNLLYYVTVSV